MGQKKIALVTNPQENEKTESHTRTPEGKRQQKSISGIQY
jgi:hypothetical protein